MLVPGFTDGVAVGELDECPNGACDEAALKRSEGDWSRIGDLTPPRIAAPWACGVGGGAIFGGGFADADVHFCTFIIR